MESDTQREDHNIVLIGYRCSGKTEVGKILAQRMHRTFLDTDLFVEERAGCTIDTLVRNEGWNRFRDLERQTVRAVSKQSRRIIATGGGVVLDAMNVAELKENGWLIWLKVDAEVVKERMAGQGAFNPRPSLTGADPFDEIGEVLSFRTPLYARAGDFSVDTSALTLHEVADTIMRNL